MPKRSQGIFSRLARLRGRVKRIKNEVSRLAAVSTSKDLKLQLRTARDSLAEADEMMTPELHHEDQPLRAPVSEGAPAAA